MLSGASGPNDIDNAFEEMSLGISSTIFLGNSIGIPAHLGKFCTRNFL